ncbi:hypothetical protein DFH08DRAFT_808320 [Mycena albidolilacea]|uniref:Cyanovirin-N domain-containing protein n=1 Tax=Mycena albidolilacea TaxID=1033008 RepID=A0AAD7A460_9AGAR|nr:hypothetical protein DFH08DRAFT_808320 [Mycena albidolilacea]
MQFASFVLTFVTLFATARAGGHGGFKATCTNITFDTSFNLAADCQSTHGVVSTIVNLNKCIKQNNNRLQCTTNPSPFFSNVCHRWSMTGTILSCNCTGVTEIIDVTQLLIFAASKSVPAER